MENASTRDKSASRIDRYLSITTIEKNSACSAPPREINRHRAYTGIYRQFSDHTEIAQSLSLPCNDALWGSAVSAPSVRDASACSAPPREINQHFASTGIYRKDIPYHTEIAQSLSLPCNDALWGSAASAPSVRDKSAFRMHRHLSERYTRPLGDCTVASLPCNDAR